MENVLLLLLRGVSQTQLYLVHAAKSTADNYILLQLLYNGN